MPLFKLSHPDTIYQYFQRVLHDGPPLTSKEKRDFKGLVLFWRARYKELEDTTQLLLLEKKYNLCVKRMSTPLRRREKKTVRVVEEVM